jgi:hypothetical protein
MRVDKYPEQFMIEGYLESEYILLPFPMPPRVLKEGSNVDEIAKAIWDDFLANGVIHKGVVYRHTDFDGFRMHLIFACIPNMQDLINHI